jgi:hypothetical protein
MNKVYSVIYSVTNEPIEVRATFISIQQAQEYINISPIKDCLHIEESEFNPSIEDIKARNLKTIEKEKEGNRVLELFQSYFPKLEIEDYSYQLVNSKCTFLGLVIVIYREGDTWTLYISKWNFGEYENKYEGVLLHLEDNDLVSLLEDSSNQIKKLLLNYIF